MECLIKTYLDGNIIDEVTLQELKREQYAREKMYDYTNISSKGINLMCFLTL